MSDMPGHEMRTTALDESGDPWTESPSPVSTLLQTLGGVVIILVIAGAAVGGAVWFMGRSAGPGNPDVWDQRVAEYVDFVEATRGLRFEHPVWVEFLSDEEFRETVTNDAEDLSEEDDEAYESFAGSLRAYGLLDGDVDLFEQSNELYGDRVVGYYEHTTKKLTIRGEEITTDVALTIVHELVHALQDQHFDLSTSDELENEAHTAATAFIEGDARAVEIAYLETLSDEEQQAYFDSFDEIELEAAEDQETVPSALSASLSSSYVLGNGFVNTLRNEGGWKRVNSTYADLPDSMDHLMYPWRYLDGDATKDVEIPEVDDPDASEPYPVGALDWFFILARVMEPSDALLIADGWGGDLAVNFTEDGRDCFRDNFTGDDTASTDALEDAVKSWVAVTPEHRSVKRTGNELQIQGCDPGIEAETAGEDNSDDALQLPVVRVDVVNSWMEGGASDESAHCAGEWIVTEIPIELLTAGDFTEAQEVQFDELIGGLSESCS